MIGTKTPFRISFAGGGSDLRTYYTRQEGCVVSATINKYMYIFVHPMFDNTIQVKYSKTERVARAEEIKHPIVREAVKMLGLTGIDINSIADIPAGTGLGSSSSFTVGLLHALHAYRGERPSKERLAAEACRLEIEILGEPIGKQDQYSAACGGVNFIAFHPDESVRLEPIAVPAGKLKKMEDSLLMFYLGRTRQAQEILADQTANMTGSGETRRYLTRMTELARILRTDLLRGETESLGPIMDEGWQLKRKLSRKVSDKKIDHYYELGRRNGARGGKLLGAGGGGFLLFQCAREDRDRLRRALKDLLEMEFAFDRDGTKIIYVGDDGKETRRAARPRKH